MGIASAASLLVLLKSSVILIKPFREVPYLSFALGSFAWVVIVVIPDVVSFTLDCEDIHLELVYVFAPPILLGADECRC